MKYFLLITFLFANLLQAEYLRTIRIGSFPTKAESQEALQELHQYIESYPHIIKLQEEHGFVFKARRSGKYHITIAEPFMQRKVLQAVIDVLRIEYPDVYVTSLKKKSVEVLQKPEQKIEKITQMKQTIEKKPREETIDSPQIESKEPPQVTEDLESSKMLVEEKVLEESQHSEVQDGEEDTHVPEVEELTINKDSIPHLEKVIEEVTIVKEENTKVQSTKDSVEQKSLNTTSIENFLWPLVSLSLVLILMYNISRARKAEKENDMYYNSKLIQEERYNELLLELKDREKYLSHLSHELRTPLTSIVGLTNLVLDGKIDVQEKEYIKQIEGSAVNVLYTINNILNSSKIKATDRHIEKAEFNINSVLDYVVNSIGIQAKKNNVYCSMNVAKDIPSHLIGDSMRLAQVLINLFGNAVKFTKDGEVSLLVKKVSQFDDNLNLEFSIEDNGIGISENQLQNVFQSSSEKNLSGDSTFDTGLGLSISKELVQMMKGKIKAKSQLGEGSVFSFTIPFKLKDHLNRRQYRLPSKELLHQKILIIDDHEKNIQKLVTMFGYFHYKAHVIPSLDSASFDTSTKFDMIIAHVDQVNDSNFEDLQDLKGTCGSKLVILSELFDGLKKDIFENVDIDGYLQSPLHQQKVLDIIIELNLSKDEKLV